MKQILLIACMLLVFGLNLSAQTDTFCTEDESTMQQLSRVRSDAKHLLDIKTKDRKWWLDTLRDFDYVNSANKLLTERYLGWYGQKVQIALPRGYDNLPLAEKMKVQRNIEAAVRKLWSTAESTPTESLEGTIAFKDQELEALYQKARDGKCKDADASSVADVSGSWYGSNNVRYVFRQTGKNFSWNLQQFSENGNGTIDGTTINARWSGNNGAGTAKGQITEINNRRATRIVWSNGIVFTRN